MLGRGVEIVVVVVEARVAQLLGLSVLQHAERAAGFEAERLHFAHHVEDRREIARLGSAPRRAHAKPCRAVLLREPRGIHHFLERQQVLALDTRVIACGLRAIAAVLGASARLDRQQRGALHAIRIEMFAMRRMRAKDEIVEGKGVERERFLA